MTPAEADHLLVRLRSLGVQMRLNAEGVMQYRDCDTMLTEAQETHVQRHRAELTDALIRERNGPPERIEEHLPIGMMHPCFGYRFRCIQFTQEEMLQKSASEFAAYVGRRRDVCGDCTLFHAQYDLAQSEEERKDKEAKRKAKEAAEERLRRNYFVAEEEA